jgi:integrase
MANPKREVDLSTPTARRRLHPQSNSLPYWRFIAEGRHLGYRPHRGTAGIGTWCARLYVGARSYIYGTLGTADDRAPADGDAVLTYRQALEAAQTWCDREERKAKGLAPREPASYTVGQCMADYLTWYAAHRKALNSTRIAVEAHILPVLGTLQVAALTARRVREWHQGIAATAPRVRSAKGAPPAWGKLDGPDARRRRQATANRVLAILKAALNFAFAEGRATSDEAWRRVKLFKGCDAPRISFLDQERAARLINSCDPDFARLVRAALCTGCRYGELIALKVSDYLPDVRAIHIAKSKSGRARQVYLGDEGVSFFHDLTAGRPAAETLFPRSDGFAWGAAHQTRRMKDACAAAGIRPAVSFHILRHTYASHFLMGGGSLPGLATQLGHADTRMTIRHYAHLADKWRAEEAREFAPTFGPGAAARSKVVRISR